MRGSVVVFRDLVRIHAVRKTDDRLHVSAARLSRERRPRAGIAIFRAISIAPPGDSGDFLVYRTIY